MAPKFNPSPSPVDFLYLQVTGGEVVALSSLAPKIAPLGLSPKKIAEEIVKETAKEWKGLKVTVRLIIQNRQAEIAVAPTTAELIIKALKEPKRHSNHDGDISIEDVIEIAKVMKEKTMTKLFYESVKEILGTCVSVGCSVDGKDPKDLQKKINENGIHGLIF